MSEEVRTNIREKDTSSRREKLQELSEEVRNNIRQKNTSSRRENRQNLSEEGRSNIRQKETSFRREKRQDLTEESLKSLRPKDAERKKNERRAAASDFELKFRMSIKEFPEFICCSCHKMCYRSLVQLLSEEKYINTESQLLDKCLTEKHSLDGKRYICNGCHAVLMKDKMPGTAVANNLITEEIPDELKDLRELECILISQRIIFFKMMNLPRGGQKGMIGSFVNIPVDTESVCSSLPRTPEESGIIPLKLKRKLAYKGHHIHQNIRPDCVMKALVWLIQNNPLYSNICITDEWVQECQEDKDMWNSLFTENIGNEEEQNHQESLCSTLPNSHDEDEEELHEVISEDSECPRNNDDIEENGSDIQERVRGVQFDTCLHPSNFMHSAEKEYCIAPGEGKSPLDPFLDTRCEALAFPHLFPTGKSTFFEDDNGNSRNVALTAKKYFIQRIINTDSRFASSIPCLFYALNVCEKQQVRNSLNIALRKARRIDISVGELRNPARIHEIFVKDQAFQFLQQVRGSPSYWQRAQYELLAMVRAKGVFTWFLTLSCADLQWPETIQAIALQHGHKFSEEDIENMSYEEKCKWLRQNPVMAARQFDHRLQSFFRDVIQSTAAPLGKVTHFYQRTEFQLRGSPHCHAVLWVENAPDLKTSSEDEICNWIDSYITCEIPPPDDPLHDEVLSKQQHTHSVACRKHGTSCRFHYPKPPCDKTLLSNPEADASIIHVSAAAAKEVLSKVNDVLTDDTVNVSDLSLQQVLCIAQVSEENYYNALKYSKAGKYVVLKRKPSSLNINCYNRDILQVWKANMDLQFVCDPYACITYIASYVTKDERELSQMLKEAAKELKDADIKSRLQKIGSVYLSNREISAQEAAYRLLSIPLKRCSSKMVWIPTDLPDERIGILKPQSLLDELDDDDTDIYALGIVEKYKKRPDSPLLNELCLWEFAAWYGPSSQSKTVMLIVCTTLIPFRK